MWNIHKTYLINLMQTATSSTPQYTKLIEAERHIYASVTNDIIDSDNGLLPLSGPMMIYYPLDS